MADDPRGAPAPSDDLFSPSLQDRPSARPVAAERKPWPLEAQFAIAFFGGVGALTTFAYLNSERLGLRRSVRIGILVGGVLAWALALSLLFGGGRILPYQIVALITWGILRRVQREPDRIHHLYGGGEASYARALGIGAALVLGFRALEIGAFVALFDA